MARPVVGVCSDNGPVADNGDTYTMCRRDGRFTYDESVDELDAEAATLPPDTRGDGVWNVDDYIIEALQVGVITRVFDDEDDYPTVQ